VPVAVVHSLFNIYIHIDILIYIGSTKMKINNKYKPITNGTLTLSLGLALGLTPILNYSYF